MTEIKNAIIRDARIFIEDHGILTAFLNLDYGGSVQGFGGYALGGFGASVFIRGCLDVVGVSEWNNLVGKTVRARCDLSRIEAIGNIIEDRWFNPVDAFAHMKGDTK